MSNKTPSATPAKTASEPREGSHKTPLRGFSSRREPAEPDSRAAFPDARAIYLIGAAIVFVLVIFISCFGGLQAFDCANLHTPTNSTIKIGTKTINTEIVGTEAEREKGLSGRPCIKDNQAMLFVFDKNDQSDHCFWMKDMRFAIDMIWLDYDKRVIGTALDVQPASYPHTFCPGRPSRYVLEVKANASQLLGLKLGSVVKF